MDAARITEVRLTAFKSFQNQVFRLEPLTILVGPNASGKSNALDALALLALLAEERAVADLERGDEEVAGLRGGLTGAAPFGATRVALGCSVKDNGTIYQFDVGARSVLQLLEAHWRFPPSEEGASPTCWMRHEPAPH